MMNFPDDPRPDDWKVTLTHRGFRLVEFHDANGQECSAQESSAVEDDFLWLGRDDGKARMHINRDQARRLVPLLRHFARYGDLPSSARPDVGCVVKGIAIIGVLAVLALVVYMGGVA